MKSLSALEIEWLDYGRSVFFACLILIILTLTACTPPQTSTATSTPYVIMTAMLARLDGKLVEVDGCIRVKADEQDNGYALVWPPDLKMTVENDWIRIVSGIVSGNRQEVILKTGEMVTLSGGITASLDEQLRQTIPANCPGPYWVVGDTIRPKATQTPQ